MSDLDKQVDQAFAATDKARQKVDLQRDKLAKMSMSDPQRVVEEALLDSMIQSAAMADTSLSMTLDAEDNAHSDASKPSPDSN